MDITIDTSVLISVVACEPTRDRAIELTRGHTLIAPSSVHWEIVNALSAMCKRGRISLEAALSCLEAYRSIALRLMDVDLDHTLRVVGDQRVYAYDAYLLCCAQQTRSPLLTLDAPLKAAAQSMGIRTLEI
jgi:predicted nucleic acid-binding protein